MYVLQNALITEKVVIMMGKNKQISEKVRSLAVNKIKSPAIWSFLYKYATEIAQLERALQYSYDDKDCMQNQIDVLEAKNELVEVLDCGCEVNKGHRCPMHDWP